jgi:hypothetical protein
MTVCAIPLSDEFGRPLFDAAGDRAQCGKPVTTGRLPNRAVRRALRAGQRCRDQPIVAGRLAKRSLGEQL